MKFWFTGPLIDLLITIYFRVGLVGLVGLVKQVYPPLPCCTGQQILKQLKNN